MPQPKPGEVLIWIVAAGANNTTMSPRRQSGILPPDLSGPGINGPYDAFGESVAVWSN